MQIDKRLSYAVKISAILVFFTCMLWGCQTQPIDLYPIQMKQVVYNEDWVQIIDDEAIPLKTMKDAQKVSAGETMILETTVPEQCEGKVLMFLTKHQEVRVWIEGKEVYSFLMQEGFAFLKTPGNDWNEVFLQHDMAGQTIRVELTSQFEYYSSLMFDFYLTDYDDMLKVQIEWLWVRIAAGAFLLIIAIISYANGIVWRGSDTGRYVLLMADFYMVMAVWVFANAGSFDIIFRRPIVSYLLEMLSLRLMPVMAYLFVRNMLSRRYLSVDIVGNLAVLHFVASIVLQFIFGISFLDTILMAHIVLMLGAMVDYLLIAHHVMFTRTRKEDRNYLFVCTGVIFTSAVAEVWRFYALPEKDVLISLGILAGNLIYTLIAHVALVHRSAGLDRGITTLKTNYNTLQNTTLMRQINAHFFFNTLNTISSFCKTDPEKADEAVGLLAKYMRHYMYFVNTRNKVAFKNEMDLVRVYLGIEQMRFEDSFSIEMDIQYESFQLPPLSIQPIVENAVRHGLRGQDQHGNIVITSRKVGHEAIITVQDNGVGFDTEILKNKESLALDNIRARLAMVKGRMEIKSVVGTGTLVMVWIPL